jgi:hypothetical protein
VNGYVVSKDVDDQEGEVGEKEGDEGVDEDDEEKSREDTALWEASAQETRRRGVRGGVGYKEGAIRKKGTDPRDKVVGCAHGYEPRDKYVVRYSIKRLRDVKEKHGEGRWFGECTRDVGDEPIEVVTCGETRTKTSLTWGEIVRVRHEVEESVEDNTLKQSCDDGRDVDEAVGGGQCAVEAVALVQWKRFGWSKNTGQVWEPQRKVEKKREKKKKRWGASRDELGRNVVRARSGGFGEVAQCSKKLWFGDEGDEEIGRWMGIEEGGEEVGDLVMMWGGVVGEDWWEEVS